MTPRGRSNTNERGNSYARRSRKWWLLAKYGNGVRAPCWECGAEVTFETMIVDRIKSGEDGGRYTRDNIRIHCQTCSCRQGQARTMEIMRNNK